jgi:hypothetical protein
MTIVIVQWSPPIKSESGSKAHAHIVLPEYLRAELGLGHYACIRAHGYDFR